MKIKRIIFALVFLVVLSLSCKTTTAAPADNVPAENGQPPAAGITETVSIQASKTPTLDTRVTVTVSTNSYCRLGPTEDYPLLGTMYVGKTAEVIGRNAYGDSMVINLPDSAGVTCWLWEGYATVVGNFDALPIITPPPVPATPTATTPPQVTITVKNNTGSSAICGVYIILSTQSGWGSNWMPGGDSIMPAGSRTWPIAQGIYNVQLKDCGNIVLVSWIEKNISSNTTLTWP